MGFALNTLVSAGAVAVAVDKGELSNEEQSDDDDNEEEGSFTYDKTKLN